MLLAGQLLGLALAACSTPAEADAALGALQLAAPDADLAQAGRVLSACGPTASSPERRAEAEADLAAVQQVAEVERRAALLYPAGGRALAAAELTAAAAQVHARAELVARLAADLRAMERADAALAEVGRGRRGAALPLLEEALADPAVRRVAGAGQLAALAEAAVRARREAGPWARAWRSVRPLRGPVLALAAAALLLALVRLLWRRSRRGDGHHDILLQDGDAASGALALALLGELRALQDRPRCAAEPAGELGSVAVIRLPAMEEQLGALAARLDPAAALSVGGLTVPLGELRRWLSRLAFPPRFTWRGALTRHRDELRIALVQRDRRSRSPRTWQASAAGTDERARAEVVRQLAYRIALSELPGPPPTRSEPAFAAHEAARALLDGLPEGAPRERLEEARALLEVAVREDPGWEAPQVRLAGLAARLGEVDLALEVIAGLARAAPGPRPDLLYEEARACAQAGDPRRVRRALALAEQVLAAPGIGPALELNARSLRAAAAAGALALAEGDEAVPLAEAERGRLQEALTEELAFFAEPPPAGLDPRAFSLARGLAQAARGAWLAEAGRAREALATFRGVLATQPDLLSAQLGIARAYRRAQPRGWFGQAAPWLVRAERLAPESAAVHYEHGSALLQRRPPDVEGAEEHLRKAAAQHPSALYKLGVLLAEERGQAAEGLRCLGRALEARGGQAPPYWAEKLVKVAASQRPMPPAAVEAAGQALAALGEAYRDLGKAAEGEDEDGRAARLAQLRRLRRYLVRAAGDLAEGLEVPAAEGAKSGRQERVETLGLLRRLRDGFREELRSGALDERERALLERGAGALGGL